MQTETIIPTETITAVETKLFYSIFSGIIYEVAVDEIPVLDEGQVPLIRRPKASCNKCYGRGFIGINKTNGVYQGCSCLHKCVDPLYKPKEIAIPTEKPFA